MSQWINSDGLVVRLGTTEAEVTRGGELSTSGDRVWEFIIDLANLGTASAILEDTQDLVFPSGLFITKVEVMNEVAATGTNAVLNLGLMRQDRSTAYAAAGLLSAAPRTDWDAAGETLTYAIGTTGVGTLVGTSTANAGVLCADYDTAAFTAGRVRVRVFGEVVRPNASIA